MKKWKWGKFLGQRETKCVVIFINFCVSLFPFGLPSIITPPSHPINTAPSVRYTYKFATLIFSHQLYAADPDFCLNWTHPLPWHDFLINCETKSEENSHTFYPFSAFPLLCRLWTWNRFHFFPSHSSSQPVSQSASESVNQQAVRQSYYHHPHLHPPPTTHTTAFGCVGGSCARWGVLLALIWIGWMYKLITTRLRVGGWGMRVMVCECRNGAKGKNSETKPRQNWNGKMGKKWKWFMQCDFHSYASIHPHPTGTDPSRVHSISTWYWFCCLVKLHRFV